MEFIHATRYLYVFTIDLESGEDQNARVVSFFVHFCVKGALLTAEPTLIRILDSLRFPEMVEVLEALLISLLLIRFKFSSIHFSMYLQLSAAKSSTLVKNLSASHVLYNVQPANLHMPRKLKSLGHIRNIQNLKKGSFFMDVSFRNFHAIQDDHSSHMGKNHYHPLFVLFPKVGVTLISRNTLFTQGAIKIEKQSKKSPTGPTERTPKKPGYLITRSQLS